jgi:hypothetical protein
MGFMILSTRQDRSIRHALKLCITGNRSSFRNNFFPEQNLHSILLVIETVATVETRQELQEVDWACDDIG